VKIRCKFKCFTATKTVHYDGDKFLYCYKLAPIYTDEDKEFFEATPQGQLEIGMLKADAFEPGKSYYLDIEEAP
jgi:hypothetical protein